MEELFGISMDTMALVLGCAVGLILAFLVGLAWRNRVMMRLGLRNIPRRRAQTVLIVFGLMLSTLIVAAAFSTGDSMTHSFRAIALDQLGEVDEQITLGGTFSLGGFDMEDEEGGGSSGQSPRFFNISSFESLAQGIASEKAKGEVQAGLVEALTPAIIQENSLIINRAARRSEPEAVVAGYDPATADDFDELYASDGKRVKIADLGPDEVYLVKFTANELAAQPGDELELTVGRTSLTVTVKDIVQPGGLQGQLIMPLNRVQAVLRQTDKINTILVSNIGGPYEGRDHSASVSRLLERLVQRDRLEVQQVKYWFLFGAEIIGSIFTTMFVGFGSFSIAAALLLIFLIFVMLAAERMKEMGMARAVGTRRRHLMQMFIFEGAAYDLAAAAVGALIGGGVGLLMVRYLASTFAQASDIGDFRLRHHMEPRSLVVAYCLGTLLTFFTVTVSSWRVSRLNIVSAIRDLPPPPNPDAGLRALFLQPWRHLGDAFRQLIRLRPHRTLKRLLWDGPLSSLSFFWALVGRGPLTILIGLASLKFGLDERSAFLYSLGVSLALIGIGLTARWTMRTRRFRPNLRDRIAFSFIGITLLVFWSLPFDALDFLGLPDLNAGPEMFVLSGIMMVAGAVWTIIYNSDLLLSLVTRLLSPFGRLVPVVRTAIAYPMHAKFRTGLTVAMFALVIFMLVFMSVFVHILNASFEGDLPEMTEYDIRANVSESRPIVNLERAIADAPELDSDVFVRFKREGRSYLIKMVEGVDLAETVRALESAFLDNGMEAVIVDEEIEQGQNIMNSILGLFQGFMGLGLVVGSASIGIISTRAVVERRQQIGVLRAIGYKPWMIQWSFLLEASFVALLGILIGTGLGLILAYNFYNGELEATPGTELSFAVPWVTLGIIAAIAYAMSMVTTYLPSWQAARIYPAEALRYE